MMRVMTPLSFMKTQKFHKWIKKTENDFSQRYNKPVWNGEKNVRLLVLNEFGIGDTIMFVRYLPLVEAEVVLSCDPLLHSLFKQLPVELAFKEGFDLSRIDFVTHLASIANKTNATTSGKSYLKPLKSTSLPQGFNVGYCWKGDSNFMPPQYLNIKGVQLVKLGKADVPAGFEITDTDCNDFNETASIIEQTDLVISVDTAVAHLAGALGKPVWVLFESKMGIHKRWERASYTGWYDSMRLFQCNSWSQCSLEAQQEVKKWMQ